MLQFRKQQPELGSYVILFRVIYRVLLYCVSIDILLLEEEPTLVILLINPYVSCCPFPLGIEAMHIPGLHSHQ